MSKHNVCYVEDAGDDSDASAVEGDRSTRIYAVSEAPVSQFKERPNTSKSRADKHCPGRRSDSPSDDLIYSDDNLHQAERSRRDYDRERERQRRRKEQKQKAAAVEQQRQRRVEAKSAKEREAKPARKPRPTSLVQPEAEPTVQHYRRGHVQDPSCFGVRQSAASGMRPRSQTRPSSYYPSQAAVTPPISHAAWHHSQAAANPAFPVGSFPPPPFYPEGQSPIGGVPSSPAGAIPSFFDMPQQLNNHLRNRFERPALERPASAMGFRQQPPPSSSYAYLHEEEYDAKSVEPHISRRPSRSKKQQQQNEDDRRRMPPPDNIPRPRSALPPSTPYRPPPPPSSSSHQMLPRTKPRNSSRPPRATRSRVGFADQREFDDEDFGESADLFNDMSPEHNFDRRTALARTRRGSVSYDHDGNDGVHSRSRRDSFYAPDRNLLATNPLLDDDKYLDAMRYQDDINGGPGVPLTAESLRKANTRAVGSSRSTRSSGSRDESEYKRSNTTGLTRSSSSDTDNVTIKVSGSAVVRVPGAEIQCADGGQITFTSRSGSSRIGSDRASTVYQIEDVRSRADQKALPYRPRATSHSDFHRDYPPSHAPYDPSLAAHDFSF